MVWKAVLTQVQILAIGTKNKANRIRQDLTKGKGFTLIELLIVIVLIGVVTGMARLAVGTADPRDQQKVEAERLLKLLELASEEAVARGEVIGLELFSQGYRFDVVQQNKWQVDSQDMLFRARVLMPQLLLKLTMGLDDVVLSLNPNQATTPRPQIVLTPDGDMELFKIRLMLKDGGGSFVVNNTQDDGLVIDTEQGS